MRNLLTSIERGLFNAEQAETLPEMLAAVRAIRGRVIEQRNTAELMDAVVARVGELRQEVRTARARAAALEKECDGLKDEIARGITADSLKMPRAFDMERFSQDFLASFAGASTVEMMS